MVKISRQVRDFIIKLKLYNSYKQDIVDLNKKLDDIYYQIGGVRGVDTSREPLHTPPNQDVYWDLSQQIENIEKEISIRQHLIDDIDNTFLSISDIDKKIIIDVFMSDNTIEYISRIYNMSPSGLREKAIRTIKKALD